MWSSVRDDFVIETESLNTFEKNREAIPAVLMVFIVGQRITPFVSPWSTMTNRVSKPSERGRSMIRSQEICWNGQELEDGIGKRGGLEGCVLTLCCWQEVHPLT